MFTISKSEVSKKHVRDLFGVRMFGIVNCILQNSHTPCILQGVWEFGFFNSIWDCNNDTLKANIKLKAWSLQLADAMWCDLFKFLDYTNQ